MKKRIYALVLSAILLWGLAGCSSSYEKVVYQEIYTATIQHREVDVDGHCWNVSYRFDGYSVTDRCDGTEWSIVKMERLPDRYETKYVENLQTGQCTISVNGKVVLSFHKSTMDSEILFSCIETYLEKTIPEVEESNGIKIWDIGTITHQIVYTESVDGNSLYYYDKVSGIALSFVNRQLVSVYDIDAMREESGVGNPYEEIDFNVPKT